MTPESAREYSESIGQIGEGWWRQIAWAHRQGIPEALGLTTREWAEKYHGYLKIAPEERREAIQELRSEGMTQREIADVIGVGCATIARDLAPNGAGSEQFEEKTPDNLAPNGAEPVPPGFSAAVNEAIKEPYDAARAAHGNAVQRQNEALAAIKVEAAMAKFETIVMDPPWPMTKIERDVRPNQVGFDYPTMSAKELEEFAPTVINMAADNCHLFMWTTQKFMPLSMRLLDAYGFKYIFTMVWHKAGGFQPTGLPQFNCEFVLYARKGTAKFIDTKGFCCCFNAARREHSQKPNEFYDMIKLVTKGPRIDVFSCEARDGFAQFGNETSKFDAA